MRHSRLWGTALLASAALLVVAGPRPRHIVRIEKSEAAWTAVRRLGVDVAQELRTCYVARADLDDLRALRAAGADARVLDWNCRGKDYILVRDAARSALPVLRAKGLAIVLEGDVLLFRPFDPAFAQALPGRLARKRLPSRPVLPFLRKPAVARALPAGAEADPDVERIVDEVSTQGLRATVQALQDFKTRYASTAGCENAGTYLHDELGKLGIATSYQDFNFAGAYASRNVIAEVRGASEPDEILVICGHYDSTTRTNPQVAAPGADDNASGTAAAIEAARVLARHPLDFTVRFVAFSAEEWGLYGSEAYARAAGRQRERIIGVVNLDMISYTKPGEDTVEIFVNDASAWLGEKAARAARAYTSLEPRRTVDPSMIWSDHASFWDEGYPALLAIETADNPYYHWETDTIDTLDFGYFTQTTRAALAVLAELAQPVRAGVPATPTGFRVRPVIFHSLFNTAKRADLSWNAVAGASGYNVYRSGLSHLDYVKVNGAPIEGTTYIDAYLKTDAFYYYVVRAVGPGGTESNPSREFEVVPEAAAGAAGASPRWALVWNGGRP
jgi:hypothetical protein